MSSSGHKLITAQSQPSGSQIFTSSGTWTAPLGVYSVSVVCIGRGGSGSYTDDEAGGGGGGLGFKNDIPVVPLQGYTVNVGSPSYFISSSTVAGYAGQGGQASSGGAGGGFVGDGGGNGSNGSYVLGGQGRGGARGSYSGTLSLGGSYGDGGDGGNQGQPGVVQIRWGANKDY